VGWHAQASKLTSQQRGYEAMAAAGIDVTPRTLMGWLSESQEPSAANKARIQAAYDLMAGGWNSSAEKRPYVIHGQVKMGRDSRNRGDGRHAPFRINGGRGNWSRIRDEWNRGTMDSDRAEELFVEDVIAEDIGEGSDPWEFPGTSYTITE
jgi:hypothetical protein